MNTVDPERFVLALTRLVNFLVGRGEREVSLPIYDPNRGGKKPREHYTIIHVIFAKTETSVHLHKYSLRIT